MTIAGHLHIASQPLHQHTQFHLHFKLKLHKYTYFIVSNAFLSFTEVTGLFLLSAQLYLPLMCVD